MTKCECTPFLFHKPIQTIDSMREIFGCAKKKYKIKTWIFFRKSKKTKKVYNLKYIDGKWISKLSTSFYNGKNLLWPMAYPLYYCQFFGIKNHFQVSFNILSKWELILYSFYLGPITSTRTIKRILMNIFGIVWKFSLEHI